MFENMNIVVAAQPDSVQTIRNLLGAGPRIIEVFKLYDASKILNKNIDLVICGLHFNDSRMFDFLRITKADPLVEAIPFLCFRNSDSDLGKTAIEALKIACNALGAAGFVDYYDLKQCNGYLEADNQFRKIIEGLLDKKSSK